MKRIIWVGSSLDELKSFPSETRQMAGRLLRVVQEGNEPLDVKPMQAVGQGVKEIRIHHKNEYRIIYVARFDEAVYVLHCFAKKTMKTALREIRLAKERYKLIMRERGGL